MLFLHRLTVERNEEVLLMERNEELLLSRRQVSLAQVSRAAQVMLRASSHLPQVPSQGSEVVRNLPYWDGARVILRGCSLRVLKSRSCLLNMKSCPDA